MFKFENKSNGRFYHIDIKKDLLNDDVIVVCNGGRFTSRLRTIGLTNPYDMAKELTRLIKRRLSRGYQLIV